MVRADCSLSANYEERDENVGEVLDGWAIDSGGEIEVVVEIDTYRLTQQRWNQQEPLTARLPS